MKIQCPKCRAAFAVKSALNSAEVYHCILCGTDFQVTPPWCLLFGRELNDTAAGFPKLGCPHCGQRYAVKFLPESGVVQCACCFREFAIPPSALVKLKRLARADDGCRCG